MRFGKGLRRFQNPAGEAAVHFLLMALAMIVREVSGAATRRVQAAGAITELLSRRSSTFRIDQVRLLDAAGLAVEVHVAGGLVRDETSSCPIGHDDAGFFHAVPSSRRT